MSRQEKLLALANRALGQNAIKSDWERNFLNDVINISRKYALTIKQKDMIYTILQQNGIDYNQM